MSSLKMSYCYLAFRTNVLLNYVVQDICPITVQMKVSPCNTRQKHSLTTPSLACLPVPHWLSKHLRQTVKMIAAYFLSDHKCSERYHLLCWTATPLSLVPEQQRLQIPVHRYNCGASNNWHIMLECNTLGYCRKTMASTTGVNKEPHAFQQCPCLLWKNIRNFILLVSFFFCSGWLDSTLPAEIQESPSKPVSHLISSRLCPSTAGCSPPPMSSIFVCLLPS